MTTHLMSLVDIAKLRFTGRVAADGGIAFGLIYGAAWCKSAAGIRTLKIKHPPAAIMSFSFDVLGFLALFFEQ